MFTPEKRHVARHSRLDLEPQSILLWVFWIFDSIFVNRPSLVESIMTRPPSKLLLVLIFTSPDVKALVSCISDVSPLPWVEANQYVDFSPVWSDDSSFTLSESSSNLVANTEISSAVGSDCLGS